VPEKGREKLRKALLEGKWLNEVQKRVVLDYQRSVGGKIEDIVVRLGFLSESDLEAILNGTRRLAVTEAIVALGLCKKIPLKLLEGYQVLPVEHSGDLVLAAENAELEPLVLEELWSLLGTQLPVVQAENGTVRAALQTLRANFPLEKSDPPKRLPQPSLETLVSLLVRKGVITEEELREVCGAVREEAP